MSMDHKNKILKLNYFSKLSTRYCEPRKGKKRTFHETIQKSKDFLFDFYDSQPYYNEVMPIIIKNNRGNAFYKNLIKKGIEGKSVFFQSIMNAIDKSVKKTIQENNKEKVKKVKYYKIPKIEILKKRKEKIDNYIKNKNKKEHNNIKTIKAYNSMIELHNKKKQPLSEVTIKSTINDNTINNLNTISNDTSYTINKNESMKNLKNNYAFKNIRKIKKLEISRNNNSQKEINPYFIRNNHNNVKFDDLIIKCNEELRSAQNIGNTVEEYNKNKSTEEFEKILKNALKNIDQKIMEEKGQGNAKYQQLEKEKFNELKKQMNIKVSDDYAYLNRKELYELIRDNETSTAYQIYLKDMKKMNSKLYKNKEIEKKNTTLIENLLEDTYRKKEFLKRKVDNYYIRNAKDNELKMFYLQNKDDLYENKDNDEHKIKGTLLPKLIDLKDYCYGRPKYDPIVELENN